MKIIFCLLQILLTTEVGFTASPTSTAENNPVRMDCYQASNPQDLKVDLVLEDESKEQFEKESKQVNFDKITNVFAFLTYESDSLTPSYLDLAAVNQTANQELLGKFVTRAFYNPTTTDADQKALKFSVECDSGSLTLRASAKDGSMTMNTDGLSGEVLINEVSCASGVAKAQNLILKKIDCKNSPK